MTQWVVRTSIALTVRLAVEADTDDQARLLTNATISSAIATALAKTGATLDGFYPLQQTVSGGS